MRKNWCLTLLVRVIGILSKWPGKKVILGLTDWVIILRLLGYLKGFDSLQQRIF